PPEPVREPVREAAPAPKETPKAAPEETPKAAPKAAPEPVVAKAAPEPVRAAPPPAPEENLRSLQELPEALQREIPKVAFGGYIYSPNPAERLLLVDKMLRREGEEVAPGLVLERILPKAAVMNYRGNRYRAGY
ncbi:general secretion pathway protein GspB, partial [Massilia sp. DD77]|uniref:general secretion pathway protein GspB n=1 Tax=Massilia sp. DD77 TaxID=3109349 RepID=UPI003000CF7D